MRGSVPAGVKVVGLLPQSSEELPRGARMRRSLAAFRRHLRANSPDLLFSAGNQGHLASVFAAMDVPTRFVVRISNELDQRRRKPGSAFARWRRRTKFRLIAARADRLVFVSRRLLRGASAIAGVDGKSVVIPNGVDVDSVRARMNQPCSHPWLGPGGGVPVVLGVGRLVQQKNFSTLVKAVAEAAKSRPLHLLIIGAGPLDQAPVAEARELNLGQAFQIIPPVENPIPYLARAAVLALPSWWEGASNTLLEALVCNTPVVASRTAGSAEEVLDHGRYGVLVDPEDARAMADALLAQVGPSPVLPGDRAEAFSRSKALEAYAELFRSLAQAPD